MNRGTLKSVPVTVCLGVVLCGSAQKEPSNATGQWVDSVDQSKAIVVDRPAAILLQTRFEDNAAAMGEEDAATVADDMAYYHHQAEEYLTERGLKVISTFDSSVVFKRDDGKHYRLERDSVSADLVVWNGKDLPLVTGSADFHDTLARYLPSVSNQAQSLLEEAKKVIPYMIEAVHDLTPSDGAITEEKTGGYLPENGEAKDIEYGTHLVLASLYYEPGFGEGEIKLDGDPYHLEFGNWVTFSPVWKELNDASGTNVLKKGSDTDGEELSARELCRSTIPTTSSRTDELGTLTAKMTTRYPRRVYAHTLSKAGQEARVGNRTLKVERIEKDLALVWIDKSDEYLELIACNAAGEILGWKQKGGVDYLLYKNHYPDKKATEKQIEEYARRYTRKEKDDHESILYIRAKGLIDHVVAVAPADFTSETGTVSIPRAPGPRGGCEDAAKERYAKRRRPPAYGSCPFTQKQIAGEIAGTLTRSEAHYRLNALSLRLSLPNVIHSSCAQVTLQDLTPTHKGKVVTVAPPRLYSSPDGLSHSVAIRPEGDEDGVVECDRVKAKLTVRYPLQVARDPSPEGFTIDGCTVTITGKLSEKTYDEESPFFRAFNGEGIPLKRYPSRTTGSQDGIPYVAYAFWGTVASVECDKPSRFITIPVELDLPAPPLIP